MTEKENHYVSHRLAELITHWAFLSPVFLRELSKATAASAPRTELGVLPPHTAERLRR